jgi:ubiquinone/menaquinone biosynthesis C-methylase UbiE
MLSRLNCGLEVRKQVEQYYNAHAARYEAKFARPLVDQIKRREEEDILSFLFEHLPQRGRLLELGCGTGLFTLPVARRGYAVTASDVSSGMLAETERKLQDSGLDNVALVTADCDSEDGFPSEMSGFDGVFGIGLLEYITAPDRLFARVFRMLKPGGVAILTAPTVSFSGFGYYVSSLVRKHLRMRLHTRRSLTKLFLRAGFEDVDVRPVGYHLPLTAPLTRVAAGRKPGH